MEIAEISWGTDQHLASTGDIERKPLRCAIPCTQTVLKIRGSTAEMGRTGVCGRGHGNTPNQLAGSDTLILPCSLSPPNPDPGDWECRVFFFNSKKKRSKKEHFACQWVTARRAH